MPPGATRTRCPRCSSTSSGGTSWLLQLLDQALEAVAVVEQLELLDVLPADDDVLQLGEAGDVVLQVAVGADGEQLAALGQPVQRLAQVLAHRALHFVGARHQRVQRAEFLEQLHGRLGADLVDAGHVVDRVAHQGLVIDHQPRRHAELRLDAGRVAPSVVHGVDHGHVLVHQLRQVLVAAGDHGDQAALGGHARERADHVVGFHAGNVQHLPAQQPHHLVDRLDLRAQVVGHGRARRLVLGIESSRKVWPGRVEHAGRVVGAHVAPQLLHHVDHAADGAGGRARGSPGTARRSGMAWKARYR